MAQSPEISEKPNPDSIRWWYGDTFLFYPYSEQIRVLSQLKVFRDLSIFDHITSIFG